jgi:hypothetical protein
MEAAHDKLNVDGVVRSRVVPGDEVTEAVTKSRKRLGLTR